MKLIWIAHGSFGVFCAIIISICSIWGVLLSKHNFTIERSGIEYVYLKYVINFIDKIIPRIIRKLLAGERIHRFQIIF